MGLLNVVPGCFVKCKTCRGVVVEVTEKHILLRTPGWYSTKVWVARNTIRGILYR